MAKKTYRTHRLKSLELYKKDKEGKRIIIKFYGGIQIDSTAKLVTKDPYIQQLVEEDPGFGRDYYIESVVEDAPAAEPVVEEAPKVVEEPKKVLTDVKDIKRFHNLVEMKNYMAELGFKGVQSMNYQQCKSAAQKEGYDFQISKA